MTFEELAALSPVAEREEKFPIPALAEGNPIYKAQYTKAWKFFEGLLTPEQYCEYADIVFRSYEDYDFYRMFDPEVIKGYELEKSLKEDILAIIDAELEDLRVEVSRLKKNSKYSSSGLSISAAQAAREIKDKVIQFVIGHKQTDDITETKCRLLTWLKAASVK